MDDHTSPSVANDYSLPYSLYLGYFVFIYIL